MRKGTNPAKAAKVEIDDAYHRIILPVYIPSLEGFFEQSFEVLKTCLQSLYTTVHANTKISVASNGCCKKVNDFLGNELEEGRIDELYQIKAGIGKINSLYKIINSTKEPLVTISDADVLFSSGWQTATEMLFMEYPKVGMVCPFSYSKGFRELTANVYFDSLFKNNIKIAPIKNPEALDRFAASIDNPNFYKPIHRDYGITYQEEGKPKALIGAGHFAATFKRDVFPHFTFKANLQRLASGEGLYIDSPPIQSGLWRFSTYQNFVYHMGNTLTPFYHEVVAKNRNENPLDFKIIKAVKREAKWLYKLKNKYFARYFFSNKIFSWYLSKIGFTKQQAKDYLSMK